MIDTVHILCNCVMICGTCGLGEGDKKCIEFWWDNLGNPRQWKDNIEMNLRIVKVVARFNHPRGVLIGRLQHSVESSTTRQ
jgi:hypothetical protein